MKGTDGYKLSWEKHKINDDCDFCKNSCNFDRFQLLHQNIHDQPCELQPNRSMRMKSDGSETIQKLYGVGGTRSTWFIEDVLAVKEQQLDCSFNRANIMVRINIDNGGSSPALTKVSMSLVIPELGQEASSDSCNNTFILAATEAVEQFDTCTALWEEANMEELLREYEVRLTCDLKMLDILFNLSGSGMSKYPCCKCMWNNRIDVHEDRDGITSYTEGVSRGKYEDWLVNYQKILDGTEPGKLTGGLKGLPISAYLVDNVERIVVTPELHLHLGIINTIIVPRLKSIFTISEMAEWELEAGVCKEDYFEGIFNGNGCSRLLEKCETVKKYAPLYYPLLQKYKTAKECMFKKRDNLGDEDMIEIRSKHSELMEEFAHMNMPVTHKMHLFHRHTIPTIDYERRTMSFFGEHYAEHVHKIYDNYSKNYNNSLYNEVRNDNGNVVKKRNERRKLEMEAYNCVRFGVPEPKKKRASRG